MKIQSTRRWKHVSLPSYMNRHEICSQMVTHGPSVVPKLCFFDGTSIDWKTCHVRESIKHH